MMPDQAAVDADSVSKSFGALRALRQVSVSFATGGCHALLGPNASGKTTLLRIIGGVMAPDTGGVRALGLDVVRDRSRYMPKIGFVPQRFCLYDELTAAENLAFVAQMRNLPQAAATERALEEFALKTCESVRAGHLSGGQRQRLMLAAALLHSPNLLLLDEPTTALDSRSRVALWQRIAHLTGAGVTVILTTHEADDTRHCDTCTALAEGQLAESPGAGIRDARSQ